jgi:soluble cytochrome b562
MRTRIATSACLILLMSGGALADDEQACMDQLAKAEALVDERFEAKALSEGDVEDVNMLLDEADAACTEGEYKKAKESIAKVKKLVASSAKPAAEAPAAQPAPAAQ